MKLYDNKISTNKFYYQQETQENPPKEIFKLFSYTLVLFNVKNII